MTAASSSRHPLLLWIFAGVILAAFTLFPFSAVTADDEPIQLDESSVIGDQELPVGLDIVPWQPAEPTSVGGTPPQLVTEELEPLDPEVFRRELDLYESTR